jgi:hypothetical protein
MDASSDKNSLAKNKRREQLKIYNERYYSKNKEKIANRKKIYYLKNKKKILETNKKNRKRKRMLNNARDNYEDVIAILSFLKFIREISSYI